MEETTSVCCRSSASLVEIVDKDGMRVEGQVDHFQCDTCGSISIFTRSS